MAIRSFTDEQAVQIAIKIEKKGAQFYRMARGVCKEGNLVKLLKMLEAQEGDHAAAFEALLDLLPKKQENSPARGAYSAESSAFLSAVAAEVVFPGGVMARMMSSSLNTVRDILLHAIQSEKDSILFYQEIGLNTEEPALTALLKEIIREEKKHLGDLQSLLEES
ncbi:MAG: ferritin family protein [Christensenellaceae bacterium]|nr:ferritin family protein [Christensenellaceae bacterium]